MGKPEGEGLLGRQSPRLVSGIKMDHREIVWWGVWSGFTWFRMESSCKWVLSFRNRAGPSFLVSYVHTGNKFVDLYTVLIPSVPVLFIDLYVNHNILIFVIIYKVYTLNMQLACISKYKSSSVPLEKVSRFQHTTCLFLGQFYYVYHEISAFLIVCRYAERLHCSQTWGYEVGLIYHSPYIMINRHT
jgi:hypothetical protein